MKKEYSILKGFWKALIPAIVVGVPMIVQVLPAEWANLTLSGALLMAANYWKVKYSK